MLENVAKEPAGRIFDSYMLENNNGTYLVRLVKSKRYGTNIVNKSGDKDGDNEPVVDFYLKDFMITVTSLRDNIAKKVSLILHFHPSEKGKEVVTFNVRGNRDKREVANLINNFFIKPLSDQKMPYSVNNLLQEYLITDFSLSKLQSMANKFARPSVSVCKSDNGDFGHTATANHRLTENINNKVNEI